MGCQAQDGRLSTPRSAVVGPTLPAATALSCPPMGTLEARCGLIACVLTDTEPAARSVMTPLSDRLPSTTGENLHVDSGFHAVGA